MGICKEVFTKVSDNGALIHHLIEEDFNVIRYGKVRCNAAALVMYDREGW